MIYRVYIIHHYCRLKKKPTAKTTEMCIHFSRFETQVRDKSSSRPTRIFQFFPPQMMYFFVLFSEMLLKVVTFKCKKKNV